MKKIQQKNRTLVFLLSMAVFFLTTLFANRYLLAFDVSSVRVSAALNPVLGIIFGWPAIFGCAVGNFLSDLVSGWGIETALLGFPSQILYGFIPYFLWRRFVGCKSHVSRLDSPKKVLVFVLITLVNSVYIGLDVGFIQWVVSKTDFWRTAFFAGLNDLSACVVLGLPLMALFDYVYSKKLHHGKRKLSFNEIIILLTSAVELVAFAVVAVVCNVVYAGNTVTEIWQSVFIVSLIAFAAISVVSFVVMTVAGGVRKKHAGLRIIEKPNGTVFADEKRRLEFVSFPGQAQEYRIKSDKRGYGLETAQKPVVASYEDAWYTEVSTQKGCPMKCLFCDCPGYGFYGNASMDDLKYQLETILGNVGTTHTRYFSVDFMRMGEPTFNEAVLDFIEFELRDLVRSKVDADVIVPTISTMLPKNKAGVTAFLERYCRIKNEVYGGGAELQFSISTTDETARNELYKNRSLSLKEIAEIAAALPMPKGNKYRLNFPVTKDSVIDAAVIDALFDKEKFEIKLTPIHQTFNAQDNGFHVTSEYDSFDVFAPIEQAFSEKGWDVAVYLDKKGEDADALTCGHLLLSNIRDKFSDAPSEKRRVGMVVAIEMGAIFERYKNCKEIETGAGFKLFLIEQDRFSLYVAQSGMGECAAAAACQFLISKCNVSTIINFGVVGGLTEEMKQLKVCLVDKVVHYKYDCTEFLPMVVGQVDGYDSIYIKTNETLVKHALVLDDSLSLVTCCSGDKFIGTAEEKTYLHETFGGDICDMESAGIVTTCDINKVPCILFKAVSDGLADGADGFFAELENASRKCLETVDRILDKIATIET
ncbi:MAG: QueT transporter family protein [Clostridia bacterium]|nr:QueT transporter family protein [Clostridia bacterium]